MVVELAADTTGEEHAPPARTCLILHGILGSRGNWRGFARRLSQAHPGWRFVSVDLRNHGDSPAAPAPNTLAECAADLRALALEYGGPPAVVVGHSFGGKVALVYARDHGRADGVTWVLDSTPGLAEPGPDHEVARVIAACRAVPMPAPERAAVTASFVEQGFSEGIANWMTTNLARADDGFRWRFDLDGIEQMIADYWRVDLWPFLEQPGDRAIHLVRAARSDRWRAADVERMEGLATVQTHVLPDAGHWVHVDNPDGLLEMLHPTFI